jgi:TolB-like protein/DNA-binding winged helix-turn-helix (wHTH) protein
LQLKADGRPLPLHAKAFDALLLFVTRRGERLDKETLMRALWPNVIVEENNLNQTISAVRRILGDTRDQHDYIVTLPGVGYQFVADVTVLRDGGDSGGGIPDASASTPASTASITQSARGPRPARLVDQPTLRWAGIGVLLVLAGVAIWMMNHRAEIQVGSGRTGQPAASGDGTVARLAVLPFTNLSPEPANAFFADGLHEEILSTLAERIPGIAVISRTTMMSYQQKPKPVGQVAQELGATHVMEGTVRREGNHVRLTLQLVDAGTDRYVWSRTYDRELASAMTLQSEVAADVATQMSVRLARSGAPTPALTHNPEAYDLYLQALLGLRELGVTTDLATRSSAVEDLLNRALTRDPQFALAYAQRARLHTLLFISSIDTTETRRRSILEDLDAARRIAPRDPIVVAAGAYFLLADEQITPALEAFHSIEESALSDPAWLIPKARLFLSRRQIDEVARIDERMLSLDPANPLVIAFSVIDFLLCQQPAAALRTMNLFPVPEVRNLYKGYITFLATGDQGEWVKAIPPEGPPITDPESLHTHFEGLRLLHRYQMLTDIVRHFPLPSMPVAQGNEGQFFGAVGNRPLAEFRGWVDLLVNDRSDAQEQGHAVLRFVAQQPQTKLNRYFLRLLEAEGYTFAGQKSEAIAAARAALEMMPRTANAVVWIGVASLSARVLAWNGAGDDAVKLLDELTNSAPGLLPAQVARDPLLTMPLAHNAQFQALVTKLEEQMAHTLLQ